MLYQSCWNNLVTGLIVPSSLLQFVNSLFQTCSNKFGTSSANTSCQQLVNRLVTTCLQVCSNLCVFTCVVFSGEWGCSQRIPGNEYVLFIITSSLTFVRYQIPESNSREGYKTEIQSIQERPRFSEVI